jgi:hypothetical protein
MVMVLAMDEIIIHIIVMLNIIQMYYIDTIGLLLDVNVGIVGHVLMVLMVLDQGNVILVHLLLLLFL